MTNLPITPITAEAAPSKPAPRATGPPVIDTAVLGARLNDCLDVLRDSYTTNPLPGVGGGWYHELTRPEPGTTATALGLLAFVEAERCFEHFDESLAYLTSRQISSSDPLKDGGWSTKTSLGMPVVEATAWIARFLARARCDLRPDAPDIGRAYQWLVRNQNPDGGWGSLRNSPSRIWLTCLALRALTQLNPYDPAIERGIEWLTADRTAHRPAWGPTPNAQPTVTHTAFVLLTLAEARPGHSDERLLAAYDWLRGNVDTDDEHIWIETYNVSPSGPGSKPVWRLALWHYGLPIALSALLRDPRGVPGGLVSRAFRTLADGGAADPPWAGYPGTGRSSLWMLTWRMEALTALSRLPLAQPGDVLHWLPDAMVIQRAHARASALPALLPRRHRIDLAAQVKRHWTTLLLLGVCLASLIGVITDTWQWRDFWLSVSLPIMLSVIQEAMRRKRPPPPPPTAR
ncbi:prenyltransferase/squalene oxidase repeat-containing protein [Actinomadura sp. 6N118]|uniref:prenyltransferase/squalene oxidase repeat-containing protein n=1 Tax=Actinomadura sp. 6N118 TaxID=3375151 RepID=UPI003798E06E